VLLLVLLPLVLSLPLRSSRSCLTLSSLDPSYRIFASPCTLSRPRALLRYCALLSRITIISFILIFVLMPHTPPLFPPPIRNSEVFVRDRGDHDKDFDHAGTGNGLAHLGSLALSRFSHSFLLAS